MKHQSKKRAKLERDYIQAKKEIAEEREMFCEGCGNASHLSWSHLVPRSRDINLLADKNNIKIHCTCRLDGSKGCHQRWEDKEWDDLLDKEDALAIVEQLDSEYYNIITS